MDLTVLLFVPRKKANRHNKEKKKNHILHNHFQEENIFFNY